MAAPVDILNIIDPVDPDSIGHNEEGWMLGWYEPPPPMEKVMLERTPGVQIKREFRRKIGNKMFRFIVIELISEDTP